MQGGGDQFVSDLQNVPPCLLYCDKNYTTIIKKKMKKRGGGGYFLPRSSLLQPKQSVDHGNIRTCFDPLGLMFRNG